METDVKTSKKRTRYPNETIRLLLERGSVRSYRKKKVPKKVLDLILSAGCHAATGGNLQPYSIIKIENRKTSEKLGKMCWQPFIGEAPVNLIFCIDWHRLERWANLKAAPFTARSSLPHFWIAFQDTIIAAQNICTAADAMGLGSVYIGTISMFFPRLKRMLRLPDGVLPVVLLCLGYPKKKPPIRNKLGPEIVVHPEKYRKIPDRELLRAFDVKYPSTLDVTKERLETIEQVCKECHGERFSKRCLKWIEEHGHINRAQHYFGLHYRANLMPSENKEFEGDIEAMGFDFFRPWKPRKVKGRKTSKK
jgi:FMN reductase [NAD(P)H]